MWNSIYICRYSLSYMMIKNWTKMKQCNVDDICIVVHMYKRELLLKKKKTHSFLLLIWNVQTSQRKTKHDSSFLGLRALKRTWGQWTCTKNGLLLQHSSAFMEKHWAAQFRSVSYKIYQWHLDKAAKMPSMVDCHYKELSQRMDACEVWMILLSPISC